LVVRPERITALPGASFAIGAGRTDDAGHFLGGAPVRLDASPLAHIDPSGLLHVSDNAGSGTLTARDGNLKTEIPITILARVAKLAIDPEQPNPNPGDLMQLNARATDATGRPVFTSGAVKWSADRGEFTGPGLYRAPSSDAIVTAQAGSATAKVVVRVGRHDERMGWFGPQAAGRWHFESAPKDGPGAAALEPEGALRLDYDFTGNQRAAYAAGNFPVAGAPLGFGLEIEGDGSGVGLRAAFLNRFGERSAVTLAKNVDWRGWQRRTVILPGDLNPPVTLVSLYAVPSLGTA
jgi:hypothetical protein